MAWAESRWIIFRKGFVTGLARDASRTGVDRRRDGKRICGRVHKHGYPNARSTPSIDGDRLYVVASNGTLVCLDRTSGEVRWSSDLVQDCGAKMMSQLESRLERIRLRRTNAAERVVDRAITIAMFCTFTIGLAASVVWLAGRIRQRRQLEQMRVQIASDLHDGGGINA